MKKESLILNKSYYLNKPLFILFLLVGSFTFSQNLIPNPSFEDTVYCPNGTNDPQALATWFNPTMASPDYYNACANNGGGVPSNDWGYQEAQDGSAYVGVAMFYEHPTVNNYREYLEVKLTNSLIVGTKYYWCMYISPLDSTNLVCNNIGISVTANSLINLTTEDLLIPSTFDDHNEIIIDNTVWTKISGSFIAMGGEEFLTIGNFETDENTECITVSLNSINGVGAYFYVDNVYLGTEPCCNSKVEIPNVFTPNSDGINDQLTFMESICLNEYSIQIMNRWGELVYRDSNNFEWDGTSLDGTPVIDGVYFYQLVSSDTLKKTGFVQVIR